MINSALYFGGPILTMEDGPAPQAVLVRQGTIAATGDLERLRPLAGKDCPLVDLQGRTLMPAFLDSHSHLTAFANTLRLIPLAEADSPRQILEILRRYLETHSLPPDAWVIAFGYDQNRFPGGAHPTKELLDQVSRDHPVVITHASGHMGVLNSVALEKLGITAQTPDPQGGKIGRVDGSGEPNGYLEETAFTDNTSRIPKPSLQELGAAVEEAQKVYLAAGITTIQDGFTKKPDWELLRSLADQGKLLADVVCYPALETGKDPFAQLPKTTPYDRHLRLGGRKIFLDGSPQGRTAWMTAPYENAPDGSRGYGVHTDQEVLAYARAAYSQGFQLLAHCNGDAAAGQFIAACAAAREEFPQNARLRPVMIHAQLVRPDQLPAMAHLGMVASFFVAHTYYWGDVHLANFGRKRGSRISPAGSAVACGVVETFHQDTPVLPPDMLTTVWCAVNRVTREGVPLAREEAVTPLEALRAVTIHAAWQYGEEDRKGSIAPGKAADLVILDRNPLAVPPHQLREIQVMETIKDGAVLFSRS